MSFAPQPDRHSRSDGRPSDDIIPSWRQARRTRSSGLRRRGDDGALYALLKRYQPQIFRFGMKMCRDPEDACEVLQDTLFAAARTERRGL
jgi:DNA-directed RNA polymerase specialized sigma24 family protein